MTEDKTLTILSAVANAWPPLLTDYCWDFYGSFSAVRWSGDTVDVVFNWIWKSHRVGET